MTEVTTNRITGMDLVFVAHELFRKPGHTGFHVLFRLAGSAPDIGVLRETVLRRWGPERRLSMRVTGPAGQAPRRLQRRLYWTERDFDLRTQVRHQRIPDGTSLPGTVAMLSAQPVPLARGGWRLHLLDGYSEAEFGLLFQVNHAIGDGVSAILLLDLLLRPDRLPEGKRRVVVPAAGAASPVYRSVLGATCRVLRGMLPASSPLPFNQSRSADRCFTWLDVPGDVIMNAVRRASATVSPTVNDICLAVVAGALRSALTETDERIPRRLEVIVPVNLRDRSTSGQLGNAISHVRIRLPLRTSDLVQRIGEIALATGDKRTARYATGWDVMMSAISRLPPLLVTFISSRAVFQSPRYASTICTAVPLLSRDLALAGRPVLGGAGGPALMGCHGLVFAFANDRGQYRICVTADGVNRRFTEAVLRGLRRELHELAALTPLSAAPA